MFMASNSPPRNVLFIKYGEKYGTATQAKDNNIIHGRKGSIWIPRQ